ncbi:MAG: FAD:protein FMN transferase [Candidatus Omnitrophica bacterium]|nr:FAD:protein FMN transferase [Candidatus Omnitrophota bacterium]
MIFKSRPYLFVLKGCGIFYFLIFVLTGCGRDSSVKETGILMDTFCEISCYGVSKDKAIAAIDAAFKEMERVEKVFNKFDEDSEVSKINRLAGSEKVIISKEFFNLTEESIYYSGISEGAFDITVAPLMEIWGFVRKHKVIPDKDAVENALKSVGYKNIALDPEELSIRFLNKGVKVDFGGIAKGYAVDRAKDVLVSKGIKNGLVNLGGNIFALGSAPGRKSWKIGVQDPRNKGRLLRSFELTDRAISTSGNYERFFEIGGKRYSHIMNPLTGEPCQGIISVTVAADSAEKADALSTAIFVMGEEKGLNFARSIKGIKVLILKEDGGLILY